MYVSRYWKDKSTKKFVGYETGRFVCGGLTKYKEHPELGVKVIEKNKLINNSIKQIIIQHHECYNGTGFPNQLKGPQVSTLGNILCLVDDFVHLMIKNQKSPTEALRSILVSQEQVSRYNSVIIESFIKVFVDPSSFQGEDSKVSSKSKSSAKKAS